MASLPRDDLVVLELNACCWVGDVIDGSHSLVDGIGVATSAPVGAMAEAHAELAEEPVPIDRRKSQVIPPLIPLSLFLTAHFGVRVPPCEKDRFGSHPFLDHSLSHKFLLLVA